MALFLYNTLSQKKQPFIPIDPGHVKLYACGPTVYDRAHIGNARAMIIFDLLYRLLQHYYPHVTYARNITDVDDKINAAAKQQGISIQALTNKTTGMFHQDMESLQCLPPTLEPRATENILYMQAMIQSLLTHGHAYTAEGHVLFSVASYARYGHLSHRSKEEMIAGARVEIAPYKKDPADFILWKPSSPDEPGWESPWGRGRPGWHIECSAMSCHYLGENFDIHGGGSDLRFPHHENEIAQSCCAFPGSTFARYWVHNGFLTVDGEKMSKSLGNYITAHDLLAKGIQGEAIRYTLLATHYRKPLDWNRKGLEDAKKALDAFYRTLLFAEEKGQLAVLQATGRDTSHQPDTGFLAAIADDLNTPKALAGLHQLAHASHHATEKERLQLAGRLYHSGKMLGIFSHLPSAWFGSHVKAEENIEIETLLQARREAREAKNWKESDRIRNELTSRHIVLEDHPNGTTSWRKI